jgi:hypothetical protein
VASKKGDDERALEAFRPARWMAVANAVGVSCAFGANVAILGIALGVMHPLVAPVFASMAMTAPILVYTRWPKDRRPEFYRVLHAFGAVAVAPIAWNVLDALVMVLAGRPWVHALAAASRDAGGLLTLAWFLFAIHSVPRARTDARLARTRALADESEAHVAFVHTAYLAPAALATLCAEQLVPLVVAFALVPVALAVAMRVAVARRRRQRAALLAAATECSPIRIATRDGVRRLVRVHVASGFRDVDAEEIVCALDEHGEPRLDARA